MKSYFKFLILNFVAISIHANCLTPSDVKSLKLCKNIRIVVPSTPGGTMDAFARELEHVLRAETGGGSIAVENRAGGNGVIAAGEVALRKDPCAFLMGSAATLSINSLNKNLDTKINPMTDFEPIALIAKSPLVLIVNKETSKIRSLEDFIKKLQDGALRYSSTGTGSINHLAVVNMEQDLKAANHSIHVPGKGATDADSLMYSDSIDFVLDNPLTAISLLHNEKMLALGTTSDKPTLIGGSTLQPISRDDHLKGFSAEAWYGLAGNKALDPKVKSALSKATQCMLNDPSTKAKYTKMGIVLQDGSADSLKSLIASDVKKWGPIFDAAMAAADETYGTRVKAKASH